MVDMEGPGPHECQIVSLKEISSRSYFKSFNARPMYSLSTQGVAVWDRTYAILFDKATQLWSNSKLWYKDVRSIAEVRDGSSGFSIMLRRINLEPLTLTIYDDYRTHDARWSNSLQNPKNALVLACAELPELRDILWTMQAALPNLMHIGYARDGQIASSQPAGWQIMLPPMWWATQNVQVLDEIYGRVGTTERSLLGFIKAYSITASAT
jgi:hypothetical protein